MPETRLLKTFISYEGIIFTLMFFVMFSLTNLIMIDFSGIREVVTSQNPLIIIILSIITAYLLNHSKIVFSKYKNIFLCIWGVYVLSVIISMCVNQNILIDEIIILLMISFVMLFQLPRPLLFFIIMGALFSLPFLLLSDITLNESGATAVLVITAGLIMVPKTNRAVLLYLLPASALVLTVTTSRTSLIMYAVIMLIYLCYINLFVIDRKKGAQYLAAAAAVLVLIAGVFIKPLYQFFTVESITADGIDLNELTSTRFNVWLEIVRESSLFGHGMSYLDFSMLPHAHNIFIDTLGRYGIITTVLFVGVMLFASVIGFIVHTTPVIGIYMLGFIMIGLTEYNYLFLFDYCAPIIILFVFISYSLTMFSKYKF